MTASTCRSGGWAGACSDGWAGTAGTAAPEPQFGPDQFPSVSIVCTARIVAVAHQSTTAPIREVACANGSRSCAEMAQYLALRISRAVNPIGRGWLVM